MVRRKTKSVKGPKTVAERTADKALHALLTDVHDDGAKQLLATRVPSISAFEAYG
jgi:hypothetical protein